MAGKTIDLKEIVVEDQLGVVIARLFHQWNILRQPVIREWEEIQRYLFATDTTQTSNSALPWKNKTTIPKLCQIRDNLNANYLNVIFPKRKTLFWEADNRDSADQDKADAILNYMGWVIKQPNFKNEISKMVLDYIDYGNVFCMSKWEDQRVETPDKIQVGYVGPVPVRISPLDIVFNPVAESFEKSPKIIRSLISMGEVKELLSKLSTPENKDEYDLLWTYLQTIRYTTRITGGDLRTYDDFYNVAGFTNYQMYLQSDYVELLTFYGDIYDRFADVFYKNYQIMVVDRHKIIGMKPNPSAFGYPPIWHCGWRKRQDNLWAMGPLANLVGLQYRLDHVENLKADVFDLIAFPTLKIKGYVEPFEWGPMERIHIGDDGDVEMMAPPFQVLTYNQESAMYQSTMEEMAGAPKEAMGFRSPGEKTAFEVSRIENASSRIFQSKTIQFEEMTEKLYNGMLDTTRRNMSGVNAIPVFDDEFKAQSFLELTTEDITGVGRIRPLSARHYAEKAEIVQNLNNLFASAIGQDPDIKAHFSSIGLAKLFEDLLDLSDFRLIMPYIRIAEQADAQRLSQAAQEQVMIEAKTAAGLHPDDYDPELEGPGGAAPGGPGQGQAPAAPGGPPSMPTPQQNVQQARQTKGQQVPPIGPQPGNQGGRPPASPAQQGP